MVYYIYMIILLIILGLPALGLVPIILMCLLAAITDNRKQ